MISPEVIVMKVAEVAHRAEGSELSPLKAKVAGYLHEHEDEVYPYRDDKLAKSLGIKQSALNFTLWSLERDGIIDKEKVGNKVYFGCRPAIADLRRRLGHTKHDPLERARTNAARIEKRTGRVDVIELLDAVRGPWQ
jgi:DNA-binding transcriptional ArsR family regulator